ncbi:hypothetical protein LCGC14_0232660 [marine sediment metagenome]|uniref:Uncharacterized protein n=1 Tax=marine sediment metagenome TaxID=412755 RepID=A0A0F9UAC2_9ZZZZ
MSREPFVNASAWHGKTFYHLNFQIGEDRRVCMNKRYTGYSVRRIKRKYFRVCKRGRFMPGKFTGSVLAFRFAVNMHRF